MRYVAVSRAPAFEPEAPVHRLAGAVTPRTGQPTTAVTRCGARLANSTQRATILFRDRPRALAFCKECR